MSKTLTVEVPDTSRLEFKFGARSTKLVLNPTKADHAFTYVEGSSVCGTCRGTSRYDVIHGGEMLDGQDKRASGLLDVSGDYAAHWFAFWESDCMDPPVWVVRAETFEQAYEDFVEVVVAKFPLNEDDLKDYEKDSEGYPEGLTLTARGWVSTENVDGREISLVSVTP